MGTWLDNVQWEHGWGDNVQWENVWGDNVQWENGGDVMSRVK
jgi:hypothetical protein